MSADGRHDCLKFVSTVACNPDFLTLDLRGDFEFAVANKTGDLLGDGRLQPLLDFDDLPRVTEW